MEAFSLPRRLAMAPYSTPSDTPQSCFSLPPLVLKRQLSDSSDASTKRRRLSIWADESSPSTPALASSSSSAAPAITPSRKPASSRPNMTASSSITLEMLRPHFEEPLAKVAASFGICVTLLKKICRRHGISRWPHRQITGLRKSITSMEHAIGYFEGARRESYAEQLLKQKNKLKALLEDPTARNPALATEETQFNRNDKLTRATSPTGPVLLESPYYQSLGTGAQPSPMRLSQQYQQLCPPLRPEPRAAAFHYPPRASASGCSASSTIHLPPLRREARPVLPPISSLVTNASSTSLASASSW
ncbi:hypothetical protein BBJ28_00014109 [Nothophytophthora sp. Chile5]|nr:hypothetical protein BBJ28_00014109 [Nothophytophthora sp. Chile5]